MGGEGSAVWWCSASYGQDGLWAGLPLALLVVLAVATEACTEG